MTLVASAELIDISFSVMTIALPRVSITSNNSFSECSTIAPSYQLLLSRHFSQECQPWSGESRRAGPDSPPNRTFYFALFLTSECQITRLRVAQSGSIHTPSLDFRLKVREELNHLVHWIRNCCAANERAAKKPRNRHTNAIIADLLTYGALPSPLCHHIR